MVSYAGIAGEAQSQFGWKLFTAMRYLDSGAAANPRGMQGYAAGR